MPLLGRRQLPCLAAFKLNACPMPKFPPYRAAGHRLTELKSTTNMTCRVNARAYVSGNKSLLLAKLALGLEKYGLLWSSALSQPLLGLIRAVSWPT